MEHVMSAFGLVVILGIAWALSTNRRLVNWRLVFFGTALQLLFAVVILRTAAGRRVFDVVGTGVTGFLDLADSGSIFIFGENFRDHFLAFKVLPTIIFFSSFITVLYYVGVMQWVVRAFAWVMMRVLRTSGAESLSSAANIFVGQTEAPLLIRPYVKTMTRSELMAVMTGGFATIAGGVLAAYVGLLSQDFPDIAGHLLAASVMSAPAALVMAKLMVPETEESLTAGTVRVKAERPWANVIDAAAEGAITGLHLALNVAAMLLAFLGLLAVINAALGWLGGFVSYPDLTLEAILGQLLRPLAWVMGVPWAEADEVGALIGIKTGANEFVAFIELSKMIDAGLLSERSRVIATYALCGFSNFSSIAIQIGGIGALAPERKAELAQIGPRAMVAGSLACFQTAAIAGMLV
ncbi:MAG TPA: NupC/NupG family nucleoside CNT transporter [Thermoanaerobaculia bacterium]|nr:NupC/NupG family nucleoside CNT transporter [Thermoanaerobaculia bacterium]